METIIKSLESSGGYAILTGVMIVGVFYLARGWMADQVARQKEREAQIYADNSEQLEHERSTTQNYHAMNERMISVIEGNTGAITTLVETIRPMSETLMRIDRHMGTQPPASGTVRRNTGSQSK